MTARPGAGLPEMAPVPVHRWGAAVALAVGPSQRTETSFCRRQLRITEDQNVQSRVGEEEEAGHNIICRGGHYWMGEWAGRRATIETMVYQHRRRRPMFQAPPDSVLLSHIVVDGESLSVVTERFVYSPSGLKRQAGPWGGFSHAASAEPRPSGDISTAQKDVYEDDEWVLEMGGELDFVGMAVETRVMSNMQDSSLMSVLAITDEAGCPLTPTAESCDDDGAIRDDDVADPDQDMLSRAVASGGLPSAAEASVGDHTTMVDVPAKPDSAEDPSTHSGQEGSDDEISGERMPLPCVIC
ncbi:unnamed protein product (mitochondrion) [Plasmodiophora brassicae]|uniref:Uncharacterized protein n=1 Tax=Plasmodiophora brassicae TaxID=37360 RepID=A0A3P3Y276_PLABS|nr:unnamed protein product [Plasmodiophora brassicae]